MTNTTFSKVEKWVFIFLFLPRAGLQITWAFTRDDEGNGNEDLGLNVGGEEGHVEEEEEDKLYRDVNINQGRGIQETLEVKDSHMTLTLVNPDGQQQISSVSLQFVISMLNLTLDVIMESIFETTSQMDVQTPTSMAPLPMTTPTTTPSTIATITTTSQAPILPTTVLSTIIQNLPNFGSMFDFDNRLRTLEANFSKFMQTNQFAGAVSDILEIVQRYMDQWMHEAAKVAIQIQSDCLRDEAQRENDEFLKTVNENMQKIIKENLYKALVEAYESDKIILKTYGETVTLKRRHNNDADKDEKPSAGLDWGSRRRREGKELESASAPSKTATRSAGRSTQGSQSRQTSVSESAFAEEPMQTTCQVEEPSHLEFDIGTEDQPIVQSSQHPKWFSQQQKPPSRDRNWNKTMLATHRSIQPWISELAKLFESRSSYNKLMDTPLEFSNFLINWLKVDTLTPKLLVGPTYELMKGSCKSLVKLEYHLEEVFKATTDQLDWVNPEGQQYPHNLLKPLPLIPNNRSRRVIPFEHFINNDLEYLCRGALSRKYTTSITKIKEADYGHIKWIKGLFYGFAVNRESARDVYSKRRIIAVTELKIVEWHNDKHLDWITMRRDDDKLYKFKEGDFKRLRIQDIEDMLLLLIQRKLTNLTVEECFAFNVSLRMFTRSIVIQRRVEELQLGEVGRDDDKDEDKDDEKDDKEKGNIDEDLGLIVGGEEGHVEEEDELYKDVNINQGRGIQAIIEVEDSHVTLTPVNPNGQQQSSSVSSEFVTSMLNPTFDVGMELIFETTSQMDVQIPTFVALLPMTAPTMTPFTIATITTTSQAPIRPTTDPSFLIQNLPNFVSAILRTVQRYMDQRMNEAVKVAIQIQSDHLRDEAQRENDEFRKTNVNEQLETEVLTQSSYSSNTSYVVAADLSEMELKKILIEKMEGKTVTLKRRYDNDADKDEEPSAGPDRGSKRRREGKEPESASAPTETATRSTGRLTQGSQSRQASASESAYTKEPMQTTFHMEEPSHPEFDTCDHDWNKTVLATHRSIQPWISELAKRSNSRSSFNELMDTPLDFSNFLINWLKESARDVYSKRRIIAVSELKIVEWHNYKHLDWITVRRDDDKLYKFKEGDFKRLRIQDIEDMLLLLVQGKLTNLTVEELLLFTSLFECLQEASSSRGVWKTFNWESKATRRGST
nr:hypothetical protein [Tanacetum cinerariifolium]